MTTAVSSWMQAATRRAQAMVALEALAFALAAALVVALAAIRSGDEVGEPALWSVALVGACACAATWWRERRRSEIEVARRVDRELDRAGALVTAFESERCACASPLARALIAGVGASLERSGLARAIPWPSPVFFAAPLVAAAVFAFAIERAPRPPSDALELLQRARVSLHAASQAAGSGAPEVEPLLAAAAELERVAATRQIDAPALREHLQQAERALAALLERTGPADADRARLQAARDLSAAALARLGESAAGAASRTGRSADAGSTAGEPGAVAKGAPTRTMSRPFSPTAPPMSAPTPPAPSGPIAIPAAEVGAVGGRWWPRRYDAVVTAWFDASGVPQQR